MDRKIIAKLVKFCAYQERCLIEIKTKLKTFHVSKEEANEIIDYLEQENYLNEERFAKAFARDKFNLNEWGKIKIFFHLQQKKIKPINIERAFQEITDDLYFEKLSKLMSRKKEELQEKETDKEILKFKVWNYAKQKGFEVENIKEIWKKM
jgi:regulatory protein